MTVIWVEALCLQKAYTHRKMKDSGGKPIKMAILGNKFQWLADQISTLPLMPKSCHGCDNGNKTFKEMERKGQEHEANMGCAVAPEDAGFLIQVVRSDNEDLETWGSVT